jgi:undecaprenyl diphosphate synthase
LNVIDEIRGLKNLPRHVAIIMDGNGRWAKERNLSRAEGHRRGSEMVSIIIDVSREAGIGALTLYAFSKENWNRPKFEVEALMSLLGEYLQQKLPEMMRNNVRLSAIGRLHTLPKSVRDILYETISITSKNSGMNLNLALSYGSRGEITDAFVSMARQIKEGALSIDDISEELISQNLYTKDIPDPDLLIRTSGEMRLSNFLLYQLAYTEIYITETYWPDFTPEKYLEALRDYSNRERRFGLTSEQVRSET